MDYLPGAEKLKPRSVRLPKDAWKTIEAMARADQRKPLDWLRLQIYERILNDPAPRTSRSRRAA